MATQGIYLALLSEKQKIMTIDNKYNDEAIYKIKELVGDNGISMFITNLNDSPLHAVPMNTKKVDNQGNLWFLSSKNNDTAKNTKASHNVQLIYSKPRNKEFLSIFGHSRIVVDRGIIKDLYQNTDDVWFNTSDDPDLIAIVVSPKEARYWEPNANSFLTLFKLAQHSIIGSDSNIHEA